MKKIIEVGICVAALAMGSIAQAATVGGINFADGAIADVLVSSSGNFTNYASTPSAISAAQLEADITDLSGGTWVQGVTGSETLDLDFSSRTLVNGVGADLAVFMVGNPVDVNVSLPGLGTGTILYDGVYTGSDISYQGSVYALMVAMVDVTDFGVAAGAQFETVRIDAYWPVSLVGALNSVETTAVPVPAAVWLFGSGLLGLVGVARRRSHS